MWRRDRSQTGPGSRWRCAVCSVHTGARKPSQGLAVVGGVHDQEEPSIYHQAGPPTHCPKTHTSVSLPACRTCSSIGCSSSCPLKLSLKEMSCQTDTLAIYEVDQVE